ncbi:conserved phage C-terminal domain-containing protein [Thiomonas sp. FB-6]|uniref:conserved phage C-terminal domain-containing protein n=1 Tax=Thiomonas sp. FB-6 TaxID=1158291 RepID=UPI00035D6E7C|nr:conserved phage C-terminal domain-containing protein [Thiomonas sp. FB-6]
MARARNIKPSFFLNEDLAEIDPLGRLLFIGLWCLADRAGRLEDRPKRIKIELLPCDACDVDLLLQALHDRGLIQRYAVGEHRLIQVTNFAKHQSPHHQERESHLPAPEDFEASGERARGKPKANPGFIPDKPQASPGAIALIPDSLIPDSKDMSGKPDAAAELLGYLNNQAGRNFRAVKATLKPIQDRLASATPEQIRAVIDDRVMAWKDDPKMAEYLRPATLFAASKFESYLGNLGSADSNGAQAPWAGGI